jgi:hypothetical protein
MYLQNKGFFSCASNLRHTFLTLRMVTMDGIEMIPIG